MPKTLEVGQSTTASVQGFDQNGQPFTIDPAAIAWSPVDAAVASASVDTTAGTEMLTGVGAGTATIAVGVTRSDGVVISASDSLSVTLPAPVLTSATIVFS